MAHGRGSGKYSPKVLKAVRREREVVKHRGQGLTYAEIAGKVGFATGSGAKKAFDRAMEHGRREPPEQQRQLELLRLNDLLASNERWLERATTSAQRLRGVTIRLEICDLRGDLTGWSRYNPPPSRGTRHDTRSEQLLDGTPPSIDSDWTEPLRLREAGLTDAEIADQLGLPNATAARRRVEHDLLAFLAGPVDQYRAKLLVINQELFCDLWPLATRPTARPVDIRRVLKTIRTRINLLQLCPTSKDIAHHQDALQKQLKQELQDIIDAEPHPGYPIFCGGPVPLTRELIESLRPDSASWS